jgi:hypothetical protein
MFTEYFPSVLPGMGSRGSSVSIVFDDGLDDRVMNVRSPAEAKDFSFIRFYLPLTFNRHNYFCASA